MNLEEKIRILVVDDHQIILDGLKSIFEHINTFEVVGYANSAIQALKFLENIDLQVLITDIEMPEQDGIWLINKVKEKHPDVKVLALTMHSERLIIEELYNLGIDGYLLKTTSHEELVLAVHQVIAGKRHFSSEIAERLIQKPSEHRQVQAELTEREMQTLELLALGLSTKEIGDRLNISDRTVEKYRASLMTKAEVKNVAGLIRFGFQNGLLK